MATPKYSGLKLGPGTPQQKAGECEIFSSTIAPVDGIPGVGDGKDGDLWIQVSGPTSSIYQKANDVWSSLLPTFSGSNVILTDSAVAQLAFSYAASSYRTAIIEYYIITPGLDIERGEMNVVNDGIAAIGSQYNINGINLASGIDFDFLISGANVEVRYDSTATPTSRVLFYRLRT